jgi:probable HAF family extracellular repeat protein
MIAAGLMATSCNRSSTEPEAPIRHVATVTLDSGIVLAVGEKVRLQVDVRDSAGLAMNFAPESLAFTIVAGEPVLAVVGDSVLGLAVGEAVLTAALDGVTSPPVTICVILHRYVVSDLGVDLGSVFDAAGALAINRAGQVAGTATLSTGGKNAFLWTPDDPNGTTGQAIHLGAPDDFATTKAADLNDAGQVVGTAFPTVGHSTRAFLWESGRFEVLAGPSSYSVAASVNNAAQILILSGYPAIWDQGELTLISGPNVNAWSAAAINDGGVAVGTYTVGAGAGTQYAWRFSGGTLTTLGVWVPVAINLRGEMVGHTVDAFGMRTSAVFWSGHLTALDGLAPGDLVVTDLNDATQIVGASNGLGVIIENGIAHDLNGMLPKDSPWHITRASGVNDQGQIIAVGADAGGPWRALLLTPVGSSSTAP